MSTRSPILEFSDNNPIPVYTPVPPVSTSVTVIRTESGHVITTETGHFISEEPPPGPR